MPPRLNARHRATDNFRLRLLASLGLSGAATCVPAKEPIPEEVSDTGWDSGDCEEPTYTATINLETDDVDLDYDGVQDALDVCPTDPGEMMALIYENEDLPCWYGLDQVDFVSQEGPVCTYAYTCDNCCGYGRPLLDQHGDVVQADTRRSEAWTRAATRPELGELKPEERAALAAYWRKNACSEHSSVAGFHRFALDLLAHGAPPELLAGAQRAASQELRHAIDAFSLVSAYLGEPTGPAALELGGSAPVARSLAELAAWTARDGAIGETLAAFLAERALDGATDPAVRRVLERVVADEKEHAELAWLTLRWAIEIGGEEVRDAVRAVFASLRLPEAEPLSWSPLLGAHGLSSPAAVNRAARDVVTRVILPVARALLAEQALAA